LGHMSTAQLLRQNCRGTVFGGLCVSGQDITVEVPALETDYTCQVIQLQRYRL
jgi:hypothetical protein